MTPTLMPRRLSALTALVTLPLLAACGTTPTAPATVECPPPVMSPAPAVPGAPAAPGQPGAPAGQANELIAKSRAAFTAMPGYALEMSFMQKKDRVVTGLYEIEGKPPRSMKIFIKEGGSQGTKLHWEGGDTIKVRAGGLLGAITVSLGLTDSRLVSVRGYTLKQTDIQAMYGFMSDPANTATLLPQGPAGPTVQVTGPKLLPGTQKMIVSFDAGTTMPKAVEFSDAREVVFRMNLKNLRPKANVSLEI